MAEHQAVNLGVAGSSPVHRAERRPRRESVYHEARRRRTYVWSAAVGNELSRTSRNSSDGSSTDESYVERGYRFHVRSVWRWRKPVVAAWALPALASKAPNHRTTLRARLLKQHSAFRRVTQRTRRPPNGLPLYFSGNRTNQSTLAGVFIFLQTTRRADRSHS